MDEIAETGPRITGWPQRLTASPTAFASARMNLLRSPLRLFWRRLAAFPLWMLLVTFAAPLHAVSTTVVVSQIYGGGGNSGATYKNDFIELHNISNVAVSLSGWSVQYASATGTTWAATALSGTIPAGGYFLVQEAAGTGGTTNLPTPDATGTLALSGTAGKVALSNATALLTGASPSGASIVDLVGFGPTASGFETAPTAAPSNTTSVSRLNSGSTDTDINSADFATGSPAPRNSATTPFIPTGVPTKVRVETAATGAGALVPAQTLGVNSSVTAYSISRDASNVYVANAAAVWSLTSMTGSVTASDLVAAGDGKSAVFTAHAPGSAVLHAVVSGLTSVDSGVITVNAVPTSPTIAASAGVDHLVNGQIVTLTVTVTPGTNPASSGLAVTADLSAIGGNAAQAFAPGAGNTFTYTATVPSNLTFGTKVLNFTVTDAEARSGTGSLTLPLRGNLTVFHTNDTHARVTPHEWIVPQHSSEASTHFEAVGGAAYTGAKILSLTAAQPDALVVDGGDISEGNPIGDWNGPPAAVGTFGNATIVDYFKLLDTKLKALPGRGGRGLDAMVVGNHDIRDMTYLNNMKAAALSNFPILSINLCAKGTHTPYFSAYTIVNVNGNKVGIIGYTTESADSADPAVMAAIDVVGCDWSSTDTSKIHFADYVNELRNVQGCTMVILLTHMGHSGLCTVTGANPTPILVDNAVARVPELVVSGHWHTYAETVWQPTSLNYKTIFTEAGSFMHYVGEIRVNGDGRYVSNANYPLRNSTITPDADIAALVQDKKDAYGSSTPTPAYGVDQVIGYTADDLLLDNYMKWWSGDEYPWSGDNTAGAWICDSMVWKCNTLFPATPCDLAIEAGGGVRSDIPAGPITYSQIYETFPWADDTLYLIKMTGQQIWTFIRDHGCDAALSHGWFVTAFDGVPTSITYNGQPIDLNHQYNVAINNYMYTHDSSNLDQIDTAPQTSTYLARTALIEFAGTFPQSSPYTTGGSRYSINTEFSGGYRAVVTLVSDNNSRTTFDDAFIRFLSATPETLGHRGTRQVPTSLVNADGSVNPGNRLAENELYRSYLGFRTGTLHNGDIIETWGKGSFFQGDPEFVDQEGIQSDGVEFKIVGHDESLAKPAYVPDVSTALDDFHKNHYVKLLLKKTGTNTAADQNGNAITVWQVDAFTKKTLPGNTNDLLVLTGVPTSESYAMRFRCDSVVLASTLGITSFPAASTVVSRVDPVPAGTTSPSITLTAQASVSGGTVYSLAPVADAQVASGNPTTNYGTSNNLFIQSSTTGSSSFGNERAWLKFDLSGVPSGSTITQAQLQLYCWGASTAALPVAVSPGSTDTWTESGLTWNTQPSTGAVLDTKTLTSGVSNVTYSWDVTSLAQTKFTGNQLVSLVAKSVTEDAASAITYKFDAKEFGSNAPVLKVTTAPAGGVVSIAQVQFFYRFSSNNSTWGSWTPAGTSAVAPYSAVFNFPQGYGYYEFYSVATDSNGAVETTPLAAQTATHFTATPAYVTEAIVTLSNLAQTFDGTPRPATVTTLPPQATTTVSYDGLAAVPVHAGVYAVSASVTSPGYTGSATGTLTVSPAAQTISFAALPAKSLGDPAFTLSATASSGLPVSYSSSNGSVASVAGNVVTIVGVGSATITAYQVGDSDHIGANPVGQTLTVGAAQGVNQGSDVPLLPPWALLTLGGSLFATCARFMAKRRTTKA